MNKALVIVDVQNDFLPGGALGVPDGQLVIRPILQLAKSGEYETVVLTRDWHPINHVSFGNPPLYEDKSWPAHCVQETPGAEFDQEIKSELIHQPVFTKGDDPDVEEYSGFSGQYNGVSLDEYLDDLDIDEIDVVGLALDYCVKATALDGVQLGYIVNIPVECTKAVAQDTGTLAAWELGCAGVNFTKTGFWD